MLNVYERKKVKDLLDTGLSHRDIAKITGHSVGTISNVRQTTDLVEENKITKVVSIFDLHVPYHINLKGFLEFLVDEQPDEIILGGDMVDAHGASKYYEGHVEDGFYDVHNELMEFKEILEEIKGICPKAKITYILGNHEDRIDQALVANPRRKMLIDYKMLYKGLVDEFIKYNDFYSVGKLYYTHGIYHNDAHAKKHAMTTQKNVRYGHLHTTQEYALPTMVGEEAHVAKCIPCMSKLNPGYMRNKPSAWLNGFNIAYIREDGMFNDYTIIITNNKFMYGGKLYS